MNIVHIVKEFEGIIGALLGVLLTLITTKWLESWGRIEVYFDDINIRWMKGDDYGGYSIVESVEDATRVEFEFRMDIYNSSSVIKTIRDIRVLVVTRNNCIEERLSDKATYRVSAARTIYDELLFINAPPKKIVSYDLRFALLKSDFIDRIEELKEIHLIGTDIKGKRIRKLIYKADF